MIIKISDSDKSAVQFSCALLGYRCRFFTNESKPGLSQVEILDDFGKEVSIEVSWYLARQVEAKLACNFFEKLD